MKKVITFIIVAAVFTLSACGQKIGSSKVPASVKESFAKQFPGIKAKWEKENEGFEATFKNKGNEMTATFDANGTMTESEMEIKSTELPASIIDYIKKNYNDSKIKEAAIITTANDDVHYEAEIKGKDLIFNTNGKFIKEIKL